MCKKKKLKVGSPRKTVGILWGNRESKTPEPWKIPMYLPEATKQGIPASSGGNFLSPVRPESQFNGKPMAKSHALDPNRRRESQGGIASHTINHWCVVQNAARIPWVTGSPRKKLVRTLA
jgi:hypothetical protein